MRKGWDALSQRYKQRLERAGITKDDYEAGRSLSRARGHGQTPEHPRVTPDRKKFPAYYAKRDRLVAEVAKRKEALWGDNPKYRKYRSDKNVRETPTNIKALEWALTASEEELIDAIRDDPETFRWLGYH